MVGKRDIGLLLMAYGGPDRLEDVAPFLADIRHGRPTPDELIREIEGRYMQIGGRSPLLERTEAQLAGIVAILDKMVPGRFRGYIGMRHWTPWIRDAVAAMRGDGIRNAVGLVMAPHFSNLSIGAYQKSVRAAMEGWGERIEIAQVADWHLLPGYLAALENEVRKASELFSREEHVYHIFSAHSLPERIVGAGDPYPVQLKATAAALARRLGLKQGQWEFCFQSAGASGGPWLGPAIEEVLPRLAEAGKKAVLVSAIGFVCDHVEILFDLDIEARGIAAGLGMHFERAGALNDHPALLEGLAGIVTAEARAAGWLE